MDPYKRIFAQGQMYWRVTHGPMSPIVVVGLSMLFCLTLLLGVCAVVQAVRGTEIETSRRVLDILYGGAIAVVSGMFWYRSYQNFRRQTKPPHYKEKTTPPTHR